MMNKIGIAARIKQKNTRSDGDMISSVAALDRSVACARSGLEDKTGCISR